MDLPNIRRMFIPDPGMTFFDTDLDSADLRIVQRESGCKKLQEWFDEGKKVYVELMKSYYGDDTITKDHSMYTKFKSFCHGSNYFGKAENVGLRVGLSAHQSIVLQKWYFNLCPEIPAWHEKLISQINKTKEISNIFGYRRRFLDRISQSTYNEAAAWIPQSTIAILINHIYVGIHERLPNVQILLQVHDSLAGQFPSALHSQCIEGISRESAISLPYPKSLVIPLSIKTSKKSWGDCK